MPNTLLRRRRGLTADTLTLAAFMLLTGCYWVAAQDAPPQTAPDDGASPPTQTPAPEAETPAASDRDAAKPDKQDEVIKIVPALDGYCPVAYQSKHKALKGSREHISVYHGQAYFLSSEDAKKKFDADPKKFLPRFGGLCATALGGTYGNRIPADPKVFMVYKDKLYLFSSERAKRAFETNPDWFIARAEPLYDEPALDGYCVVSYQTRNKAVDGLPEFATKYRGQTYRFASLHARQAFLSDPTKYLPQYDAYCAEGVVRNELYPGDPEVFVVVNGRTFLFFNDRAKMKFVANPFKAIEIADANWATLKKKAPAP